MVFSFRSGRISEFRRRTAPGCSQPTMDAGDWRTQLPPDSRQRIVNKITDTLKRHLPFTGEEGLLELRKIAVRFEEKIYTAATSPSDYLRKISLKMLAMENKHQNFVANSPPLNAASNITKPPHTGKVHRGSKRRRTAPVCSQPTMDAGDWRTQLPPDSRQRIVNKITDTLKRHLPFTGEEGLLELRKIAVRFEEKIYTAATSPSDYLRKISLKMLAMENKHQNFVANSPPLNAASNITKPPHTGAAES
ncbi:hypothetical protein ACSBR1_000848 [Camellia fascicularis]